MTNNDLVSLVYFSHARHQYDDAALLELLRVSRENNARADITGMLLYHDGNFAQALEGPRETVRALFERISRDPAHEGLIATALTPIAARQFPDWSMGFLPSESLPENLRDQFREKLSGESLAANPDGVAASLLEAFRDGVRRTTIV